MKRVRNSERLLCIEVRFASPKCIATKIFVPVQLFKKLVWRMPDNGHTPRTLSSKWRVQQAVTPRQINEITTSLIKRPRQLLGHPP